MRVTLRHDSDGKIVLYRTTVPAAPSQVSYQLIPVDTAIAGSERQCIIHSERQTGVYPSPTHKYRVSHLSERQIGFHPSPKHKDSVFHPEFEPRSSVERQIGFHPNQTHKDRVFRPTERPRAFCSRSTRRTRD